jgi:serine protease Do
MLLWHNHIAGIEFERVDSQLAAYFGVKSGVLVRAVQPGSAADKAGLRAGDVIFSVAQQTFFTDHEVSSLFRRHSSVSVSVMRDHKRVDLMLNVP